MFSLLFVLEALRIFADRLLRALLTEEELSEIPGDAWHQSHRKEFREDGCHWLTCHGLGERLTSLTHTSIAQHDYLQVGKSLSAVFCIVFPLSSWGHGQGCPLAQCSASAWGPGLPGPVWTDGGLQRLLEDGGGVAKVTSQVRLRGTTAPCLGTASRTIPRRQLRGSEAKKFKGAERSERVLHRDGLSVYGGVHLCCLLGCVMLVKFHEHGERMKKTHKKQVATSWGWFVIGRTICTADGEVCDSAWMEKRFSTLGCAVARRLSLDPA